jgi:hypothetical protein
LKLTASGRSPAAAGRLPVFANDTRTSAYWLRPSSCLRWSVADDLQISQGGAATMADARLQFDGEAQDKREFIEAARGATANSTPWRW